MPTGRSRQALPRRQPRMERVGLRRRWLLTSTAIGVAGCLALSQLVYANDECGAIVGNSIMPFDQQLAKLEGGVDARFTPSDGARAVLGGFAGAGRAEQGFEDSTSEARSEMALAGVYGGYRKGAVYGNAILKYEHHWAELTSVATSPDGAPFDVDLLGGSIETGYRFAAGGSYMQPRIRVNYAHGWVSSLTDASGVIIDLRNAESLSGEAAARVSP